MSILYDTLPKPLPVFIIPSVLGECVFIEFASNNDPG